MYIAPGIAEIVRRAFELYATGTFSDADIATWVHEQPVIQALRQDKQPVNKEMVRDMLQNRVYTGRVPYAETLYSGTLGQGKQSNRKRKQWFEGKHAAIISDELFDQCQAVRESLARYRKTESQRRTYILHDRVYCAACITNKPAGLVDERYGKMRPFWHKYNERGYYRCLSKDRGYEPCGQGFIPVDELDEQVVAILAGLHIPADFRQRVEAEVRGRVENEAALQRMAEIQEIITRIDFRWDSGFFTSPEEYVEKRRQLERELDSLRPIDYDELMEATDLVEHFRIYWDRCAEVNNPEAARQQLLNKIVERVFVFDGQVIAVVLHGDFGVVLGEEGKLPGEIIAALETNLATDGINLIRSQNGSDGGRALACIRPLVFIPRHVGLSCLSHLATAA